MKRPSSDQRRRPVHVRVTFRVGAGPEAKPEQMKGLKPETQSLLQQAAKLLPAWLEKDPKNGARMLVDPLRVLREIVPKASPEALKELAQYRGRIGDAGQSLLMPANVEIDAVRLVAVKKGAAS
jgi:hypothetical protein